MKTKLIALAVAAAVSFSANAALEDSFTFGVGAGWNHQFGNFGKNDSIKNNALYTTEAGNKDGYGIKLNAEYNLTNWFGLGLGYNYLRGGKAVVNAAGFDGSYNSEGYKVITHVAELYGRFAYALDNNGSDIFFKVGPTANWTRINHSKSDKMGAVAGVGAQWAVNNSIAVRVGYDFYYNTAKYDEGRLNNGLLYASVNFTFGGPQPVVAPAKQTVKTTEKFTLDQSILFPFDSSVLSETGKDVVSQIAESSKETVNAEYAVYGYTDRIGSDAYNMKLSQKRADSVTAQFNQIGVTSVTTSEGRGKADPVTGDKCDAVKGRKALVDCLAPDRRVEVLVSGETVIEE